MSLHVSSTLVLIIRGQNFFVQHLVSLHIVRGHPVHRTATYRCDDTRGCIIQF